MAPDHSRIVMPPTFAANSADRLSALPNKILQHILSFLPAQEAVRTCVLARRWRNVWKIVRCLRITGTTTPTYVRQVCGFVDRLLQARLRRISYFPLDMCEIKFDLFNDDDKSFVHRWIGRVVQCRVQSLLLHIFDNEDDETPWFPLPNLLLFSPYLTRLELYGIEFSARFAHFSSCPALQDLKIEKCDLSKVWQMESPSLRWLSIADCISCPFWRFRISVPRLVWLWLDIPSADRTPQLESMPELAVACVRLDRCLDECTCEGDRMDCCHVNQAAYSYSYSDIDFGDEGSDSYASDCAVVDYGYSSSEDDDDNHDEEGFSDDDNSSEVTRKCVLLGGLSEATDLTLISGHKMFVFRRDLRWCPTFSKLRTLLINDYWCEPPDCRALVCILEHSPVLEKLTIVLSGKGPKYKVEMKGCLNAVWRPDMMTLEHLRIVEVKCDVVNDTFHNVLRFLDSLNIWFPCEEEKTSAEEEYTTQILSTAKLSSMKGSTNAI